MALSWRRGHERDGRLVRGHLASLGRKSILLDADKRDEWVDLHLQLVDALRHVQSHGDVSVCDRIQREIFRKHTDVEASKMIAEWLMRFGPLAFRTRSDHQLWLMKPKKIDVDTWERDRRFYKEIGLVAYVGKNRTPAETDAKPWRIDDALNFSFVDLAAMRASS